MKKRQTPILNTICLVMMLFCSRQTLAGSATREETLAELRQFFGLYENSKTQTYQGADCSVRVTNQSDGSMEIEYTNNKEEKNQIIISDATEPYLDFTLNYEGWVWHLGMDIVIVYQKGDQLLRFSITRNRSNWKGNPNRDNRHLYFSTNTKDYPHHGDQCTW